MTKRIRSCGIGYAAKSQRPRPVRQQLAEERARADQLGDRVGELERALSVTINPSCEIRPPLATK
jgi:hypothetical protein